MWPRLVSPEVVRQGTERPEGGVKGLVFEHGESIGADKA
jgi:hypothetical protein